MSVEIRFAGGLGNNLFQYAFARILAQALGRELVCVPGPRTSLARYATAFADAPQHIPGRAIDQPQLRYTKRDRPVWDEHGVDLDYLVRACADKRIVLHGFFQRAEFYVPHRRKLRQWFAPSRPRPAIADVHRDDVVVHVRRGDYLAAGSAVCLEYYQRVLDLLRPRRVFVTGAGIDAATRTALARYEPQWLDLDAVEAMWAISRFQRIVAANSTFSWWGAFLSRAGEVYFPRPVSGLWSVETARIALEIDDPGWHYVDGVEVEQWRPYVPRWGALDVRESSAANRRGTVHVTAADGRARQLEIDERLVPLCSWLATRSSPFGYTDAAHLVDDVPGPMLVSFLDDLVRMNGLVIAEHHKPLRPDLAQAW